MGEIWIPEAEDLTPAGIAGTMSGVGPARAIAHVTVSPSGISSSGTVFFDRMDAVLTGKKAEPHLLIDPITDRLGQYFPLNKSARALMNGGKDISHNKVGQVCIQVEFVANPDGFTRYWKPGPNFRAMMRAIRSWGIEDEFIARPARSYSDDVRQSWSTYKSRGGWWHHAHVPEPESHWDCGPIDHAAFFAAAPTGDEDMPLTDADVQRVAAAVIQLVPDAVWSKKMSIEGVAAETTAGAHLMLTNWKAGRAAGAAESAAEKLGAPIDVDEAALAVALTPSLGAAVQEAVKAVGLPDVDAQALAEAVIKELGVKLGSVQEPQS